MPANVELLAGRISVKPGETATTTIRVTNTGRIVDELSLQALGDAAAWMTVAPAILPLFPGAVGQATVTFAPPRGTTPEAGVYPFAVRVRSREDRAFSFVAEGRVDVAARLDVTARMGPRTSAGSRRSQSGVHRVEIDNGGNTAVLVNVAASDADERMLYEVSPESLSVAAGARSVVQVRARSKQRLWNGQPVTLPFSVVVTPVGAPPIQLDGGMTQRPTIPPALIPTVGIGLAGVVALVVASQTILKPAASPEPSSSLAAVASAAASATPTGNLPSTAAPTASLAPPTASPSPSPSASASESAAPTATPTASTAPTAAATASPTASPSPLIARILNLSLIDPSASAPVDTPVPSEEPSPEETAAGSGGPQPTPQPLPSWPVVTFAQGSSDGGAAGVVAAAAVARSSATGTRPLAAPLPAQDESTQRFQQLALQVSGPVGARITSVPDNSAPRICLSSEDTQPICRTDQQPLVDTPRDQQEGIRFLSVVAEHGGTTVNLDLQYQPQGATLFFRNIHLGPGEDGAVLDILVRPTQDDVLLIVANELSTAADVQFTLTDATAAPGPPVPLTLNRTAFVPVLAGHQYAVRLTTTSPTDVFVSGSITWP